MSDNILVGQLSTWLHQYGKSVQLYMMQRMPRTLHSQLLINICNNIKKKENTLVSNCACLGGWVHLLNHLGLFSSYIFLLDFLVPWECDVLCFGQFRSLIKFITACQIGLLRGLNFWLGLNECPLFLFPLCIHLYLGQLFLVFSFHSGFCRFVYIVYTCCMVLYIIYM